MLCEDLKVGQGASSNKSTILKIIPQQVFLGKSFLKIGSKFTGEHPYQSVISIKLLCNSIEIKLWYGCSPVNFLHTSRTPFPKNTFGRPLLCLRVCSFATKRLLHNVLPNHQFLFVLNS